MEQLLQVSQPTTVGIINALAEKGLVCRTTSPTDKRVKIVSLTDSGKDICTILKESVIETDAALFSSYTQEEKHTLLDLLQKLLESLT